DRIAVGREAAKAAPAMIEPFDRYVDGLLKAVDAFGKQHVVGIGIMRIDRCRIGGRYEKLAAGGLGIPGLARIADEGPGHDVGRCGDNCDAPALGLQSEGPCAGSFRYDIAPGTGGIDDDRGYELAGCGFYTPAAVAALDLLCSGIADDLP